MERYKMKQKRKIYRCDKVKFSQELDVFKILSCSIANDTLLVNQFNSLSRMQKKKIKDMIKNIKVAEKIDITSSQFDLQIVDIHIIAEKFNIDPATVCLVGCFANYDSICLY